MRRCVRAKFPTSDPTRFWVCVAVELQGKSVFFRALLGGEKNAALDVKSMPHLNAECTPPLPRRTLKARGIRIFRHHVVFLDFWRWLIFFFREHFFYRVAFDRSEKFCFFRVR